MIWRNLICGLLLIACLGLGLVLVPVARASNSASVPMTLAAEIIEPLEVNVVQSLDFSFWDKLEPIDIEANQLIDYQIQFHWNEEWGFTVVMPPAITLKHGELNNTLPVTFTPTVEEEATNLPQTLAYQLKFSTNGVNFFSHPGTVQGSAVITVYAKY